MTISIVATRTGQDMDSRLSVRRRRVALGFWHWCFSAAILAAERTVFWRMNISTILRDIARLYDEQHH